MSANEKKQMWGVALTLWAGSFVFFQFFYSYHLFFREQVLLFLNTSDYFLSYFNKPGWLACYAGDFFTQFFYLRGGGPLVLSALFVLEWWITRNTIRRITSTHFASLWAIFPVLADWILHCDILCALSVSVGYLLVLVFFRLYTIISKSWIARIYCLLIALAGYWMIGSSVFVFPVLVLIYDYYTNRSHEQWFHLLLIGITGLTPLLLRSISLLPINQVYLYPAMSVSGMAISGVLILVLLLTMLNSKSENNYPRLFTATIVLFTIVFLGVGIWKNSDFEQEKILSLDCETYFGNTDRVLELVQKYEIRNRLASYYTNMALAKRGELGDRLMEFYQPAIYGLMLQVLPDESWMTILFSNEVFYLMGDMNMAQHSAMLGITFSPWQRGSRMVKRLAEINMINSDMAAAGKYLRLLSKTMFHRKWAEKRLGVNNSVWLEGKRAQIFDVDTLRKSGDYLASLKYLVEQKPSNEIALNYLLCYHLLNKDLVSFRDVYDRYARTVYRTIPSVYEEALLIVIYSSGVSLETFTSYGFDKNKIKEFQEYTKLFDRANGDMKVIQKQFGKTYWFYYHFATIQTK